MSNLISVVKGKLDALRWNFIIIGVVLLILSILIVWTDIILRLLVGLFVLLFSYCLFYVAHKIHVIRKHLG